VSRFEYFSVLLAIVIGLGVSEVLAGWGRLLRRRRVVRFYWVHAVWSLSAVLGMVEYWWRMWTYHDLTPTSLPTLLATVSETCLVVLAALVLTPEEIGADGLDLRSYYYEHKTLFFAIAAVWFVELTVVEHWHMGRPYFHIANAIRGFALIIAASAATSDREDVHAGLALASLLGHSFFVAVAWYGW
jgi:hypothetical protein